MIALFAHLPIPPFPPDPTAHMLVLLRAIIAWSTAHGLWAQ